MNHHTILIVGGGNAGIAVAARLHKAEPSLDIAIIEPSEKHYYQPAWTLVGAGVIPVSRSVRPMKYYIPEGVTWIKGRVTALDPEKNQLTTATDDTYAYDYLIVCPGIQINWHLIRGLKETLGRNGVTSNYSYETAPYTYKCLKNFQAGQVAIFTHPSTPVKCGGAPQKIMYLAADYFLRKGLKGDARIDYSTAGKRLFPVPRYEAALQQVVDKYRIEINYRHDLVGVDGEKKIATFRITDETESCYEVSKSFDMIHVTPPQSAPAFIISSPMADTNGWLDVDPYTLQQSRFQNVFGLGDVTNTPNAKTGAAITRQAPVVVQNLLDEMKGKPLSARYDGYGSCPLVVGYGKLILAEFDYDLVPRETFPFDQSKPRWTMWLLKRHFLPWYYWHRVLKGLGN